MSAHKIQEPLSASSDPRFNSELLGTLHPIFRTEEFAVFLSDPYCNAKLRPLQAIVQQHGKEDWQAMISHIELLPAEVFTTAHRGILRAEVQSCLHPERRGVKGRSVFFPGV